MKIEFESLSVKHAEALQSVWGDSDVIKYTNIKSPCNKDEIIKRIKRFSVHDVFAVVVDGKVAGVIGCPCETDNIFGLFYMLDKKYWHNGIASYSAEWILKYMKSQYKNAVIYADVIPENKASEKILINNGFVFEGIRKEKFLREGKEYDIKSYVLKY